MAPKAEGIWPCIVLDAYFGTDLKGLPEVQINVQIDDGPNKGQRCTYEDQVNVKSALYIGRSCRAIGWKGDDLRTLKADCDAWIKATGGRSTVEIKHLLIKSGKRAGEIWDKPNSIGRGPKALAPATGEVLDDANDAMRAAMAEDKAGGGDGTHDGEDGIPF